jgi:hypothetical protein
VTKDDELVAEKQGNAVCSLQNCYFTEEVRAKKQLNQSAADLSQGK